jgi:DNA-binding CsgD family transcriptional regulator
MDPISDQLSSLTEREREVLRLLANGHDIKSIARELSISTSAVTDRLRHARRKLGVSTSREAARMLANGEVGARFGVHTLLGEESHSDLMHQKRSKRFSGIGIVMLIVFAAAATYFSNVHVGNSGHGHGRAQFVVHSAPTAFIGAASQPVQHSSAVNPRKFCDSHGPTYSQAGNGFTLKCAAHPHGPQAIPLNTSDHENIEGFGTRAPPPHEQKAGVRPIPHTSKPARRAQ